MGGQAEDLYLGWRAIQGEDLWVRKLQCKCYPFIYGLLYATLVLALSYKNHNIYFLYSSKLTIIVVDFFFMDKPRYV